jgi:Flp pilus assembly protein TadG
VSRRPGAAALCQLRILLRDRSGVSAVEFALVAPFMLFIYLGGQQLADAIFANRKVTTATRAVTDLTTQYSVVTANDLTTILNAGGKVLAPYSAANAHIRVSQISIDVNKAAKVSWSKTLHAGDAALQKNAPFTVPADLLVANTSLIYGEITYDYTPIIPGFSVGSLTLSDHIFMSPRASSSITYSDS